MGNHPIVYNELVDVKGFGTYLAGQGVLVVRTLLFENEDFRVVHLVAVYQLNEDGRVQGLVCHVVFIYVEVEGDLGYF